MITFDTYSSIVLYLVLIISAVLFAYIAQKFSKKRLNKFFWWLSFLSLWIPVAFRASGVDHVSYYNYFVEAQALGTDYFSSYQGSPEPLFALLIYLIALKANNFQYVYIITSFIALFFTYLGFSKMGNRTSLPIVIWWFSTTYYMSFYGLVRMSVAIGIMTYALHFIEKRKMRNYLFFCIIATLFHYSACFMFIVYLLFARQNQYNLQLTTKRKNPIEFINKYTTNRNLQTKITISNKLTLKIVLVGLSTYAIYKIFPYLFNGFIWYSKYTNYFDLAITFQAINNLAGFYLLFILLFLFQRAIKVTISQGVLYVNLTWIMLVLGVISVVFPITRLTYYLMPVGCYVYGFIPKLLFDKRLKFLLYMIYLIVGVMWWYYVYMTPGLWGNYILPYKMNLSFH